MPNHVINHVTFDSRFDEIKEYVKGENGIFDFNEIVSMPEAVLESTKHRSSEIPLWYDWSVENWGTKWNCYEQEHSHNGFQFWTAWSTPLEVLESLSDAFPDVKITVQYADENLGYNCGTYVLQNGSIIEQEDGDYIFSCELWGYEPQEEVEEEATND
jgi:hypothetical protein